MNNLLLKIAGYNPLDVNDNDKTVIKKLSYLILLAAFIEGLNGGIAAHSLMDGTSNITNTVITIFAAILCSTIVIFMDSAMLYFSDINSENVWYKKIFYLIIRVSFVLLIGSITSSYVIPYFFKGDLSLEAINLVNKDQINRKKDLNNFYDVPALQMEIAEFESKRNYLIKLMNRIPARVVQKETIYNECLKKINVNFINNFNENADNCIGLKNDYEISLYNYKQIYQTRLNELELNLNKTKEGLRDIKNKINSSVDLENKKKMELTKYNSSVVLDSLMKNNKTVSYKIYIILGLLCLFELSPILLKSMTKQTVYGINFEWERNQQEFKVLQDKESIESNLIIQKIDNEKLRDLILNLPIDDERILDLKRQQDEYAKVVGRLSNATIAIKDFIQAKKEIEKFKNMYPQYSNEIDELYHSIIIKTVEV